MKDLPLKKIHESLGAQFENYSGWTMPKNYGDVESEYRAVREIIGIVDLSSRGKLKLSGKDHLKFLQGMLSNDVMKLGETKGVYATVLTVKGKMISDMRVYKDNDSVLIDLEPGANDKVVELLTKFRLSYKADIDDMTETQGLISIQGPDSPKLLSEFLDEKIPDMEEYDFLKRTFHGAELFIVYVNRTGEHGYDLYIENQLLEKLWEELMSKGKSLNPVPVGYEALNTLRIEAGIPVYDIDMDENNIPIEAGIWNALNFEKGCYVGQEVVARIKWRGHVNWHLVGFEVKGEVVPDKDDEIFIEEKKVGRVTSSTLSPYLKEPICLGYIRREHKDPDTQVSINLADGNQTMARVIKTPLYRGSFNYKENSPTA